MLIWGLLPQIALHATDSPAGFGTSGRDGFYPGHAAAQAFEDTLEDVRVIPVQVIGNPLQVIARNRQILICTRSLLASPHLPHAHIRNIDVLDQLAHQRRNMKFLKMPQ